MDSYRLIINNYDLSTSNIEQTVNYTGFTVIKAPKGPCTPVRIPAAGTAKIQDIFGVPSVDYPELYEATTFNADYDLYVSAPYTKATVPVALVTPDGIYPATTNMLYNSVVEDFINGTVDEDEEFPLKDEDGNAISSVLMDSRYPKNNFGVDHIGANFADLYDLQQYPDYNNGVIIDTGLFYTEMNKLGLTTFRLHNLPVALNGKNYVDMTFRVNSTAQVPYVEILAGGENGYVVGSIVYKSTDTYINLPYSEEAAEGSSTTANTPCVLRIVGRVGDDTVETLTDDYVVNNLKDYAILRALRTSWVKTYTDLAKIKGVILPKYPSERALHLSFAKFNANKGYSVADPAARNVLKITAYEDDAFHNASHPVTITGSLESSAQDANGAYIGFTPSNSSFNDQNLVYVHSMDNKGFTKEDIKDLNKSIKQCPPIVLDGGTREFNQLNDSSYDSTALHNLGWEIAKNEEYSTVHVFFDSERHLAAPSTAVNTFFTLDKIHPLAGFIFNYTLAPADVKADLTPLAYGFNYWNIDNEAIVVLPNSDRIISPGVGARALMQCRIIENRWGGIAPMYLNSGTPSMGGQLSIPGLYKLRYKYSKEQQEILDELNFNPIIQDHSYGVMVVGQKTCKEGDITDWSYIGHVSAFFTFQREVREQVMIPQLGKANNPYYRTLRREQVLQLLSKRLEGNNRIWAEASVDTSTADGCNDVQAQRARKFIINVKIKVDIFSEYVELNFTTVDQSMSVED